MYVQYVYTVVRFCILYIERLWKVFWVVHSRVYLEFYLQNIVELITGCSLIASALLFNLKLFSAWFSFLSLRLCACQSLKRKLLLHFFLSIERRLKDSTAPCSYYSRHWPCTIHQQEQFQVRRVTTVIRHHLLFSQILWGFFFFFSVSHFKVKQCTSIGWTFRPRGLEFFFYSFLLWSSLFFFFLITG